MMFWIYVALHPILWLVQAIAWGWNMEAFEAATVALFLEGLMLFVIFMAAIEFEWFKKKEVS